MLIEKINSTELNFMECWHTPECLIECLFNNFDSLAEFKENAFGFIRPYQLPILSQEPLYDFKGMQKIDNLTDKETFNLKKNVADIYNFGARRYGKTLFTECLDVPISMLHDESYKCGFTSMDMIHLRGVLDGIASGIKRHPILKEWISGQIRNHPNYFMQAKNGWSLTGVNMNLKARKEEGCFDNQTEILTNSGWKFFKDLTYDDKVLSMNPDTEVADYYPISYIHKYKYDGNLKQLNSRTSQFLVTPNHNLFIVSITSNYKMTVENNKLPEQIYCPSTYIWNKKINNIIIDGQVWNKKIRYEFKMEDWVKFLAWYLSEGSCYKSITKYIVQIPQKKKKIQDIEEVLKNLNIKYSKNYDKKCDIFRLLIYNKVLAQHLLKYCGKIKSKRIPSYLLMADKKMAKIFITEYLQGDGYNTKQNDKYEYKVLFTSLKSLADDLQIVSQNAGYKTHLRENLQQTFINNHHYSILMYFIYLCRSKNTVFKKKLIKDIYYSDKVYCVDVKPFHTIFVRRNGCVVWTYNSQFFAKHFHKLWGEEMSFENEKVYKKRLDAKSELGMIERFAGMTNFTKHMPAGKAFFKLENKRKILNLPQYVNKISWDETEKKDRIEEYGGISSNDYQIFVEGEVVEGDIAEFDMDRVRENYDDTKDIKRFEIKKENFNRFKDFIVVERPKNASQIFIASDVGDGAGGTDIVIVSEVNGTYRYLYNVTLLNLKLEQQEEIFKYIIENMQANVIGIECGEACGRALADKLEDAYGKRHVVRYSGNDKVRVGFVKTNNGDIVWENGQPVYKEEFMSEWSVNRLKHLLYNQKFSLPTDYRLDKMLNAVISSTSGERKRYICPSGIGDHLFDAFRVLTILLWQIIDFNDITPINEANQMGCGTNF